VDIRIGNATTAFAAGKIHVFGDDKRSEPDIFGDCPKVEPQEEIARAKSQTAERHFINRITIKL
jgi:hypothetical protein